MKVIMSNFMMLEREFLISHMENTISFMVGETSIKCSFQKGDFFFWLMKSANYVCFPTRHKTLN
jgi:hypothetical protein